MSEANTRARSEDSARSMEAAYQIFPSERNRWHRTIMTSTRPEKYQQAQNQAFEKCKEVVVPI
eukprot:6251855-Amphidinium_carterae.2